jgi:hypothetical protein
VSDIFRSVQAIAESHRQLKLQLQQRLKQVLCVVA